MCLIIVAESERPDQTMLEKAARANPHGAGIAYFWHGKVRICRSLKASDIIEKALLAPLPFLVHFRLASAGEVCLSLCHPFPVETYPRGNSELVVQKALAHNGHWSEWESYLHLLRVLGVLKQHRTGPWSDTRLLASLTRILGEEACRKFYTSAGRVAVIGDRRIRLFGDWHKEGGLWYSNGYWRFKSACYYWRNNEVA